MADHGPLNPRLSGESYTRPMPRGNPKHERPGGVPPEGGGGSLIEVVVLAFGLACLITTSGKLLAQLFQMSQMSPFTWAAAGAVFQGAYLWRHLVHDAKSCLSCRFLRKDR